MGIARRGSIAAPEWQLTALPRHWLIRPEGPGSTLWRTFTADLRVKVAARWQPITAADVDRRRIAAECASVDARGALGLRPEPAAAIVRRRGGQTRRAPRRRRMWRSAGVV